MLDIDKILTCTTGHITADDNIALGEFADDHREDPSASEHYVVDTGYGFMLWVNSEGDFTEYGGKLSDAALGLLGFAFNQGVQWLRFDRDASELDGFPTFDW